MEYPIHKTELNEALVNVNMRIKTLTDLIELQIKEKDNLQKLSEKLAQKLKENPHLEEINVSYELFDLVQRYGYSDEDDME
jgi:hypothetical protein